jgi:hypothetical protein
MEQFIPLHGSASGREQFLAVIVPVEVTAKLCGSQCSHLAAGWLHARTVPTAQKNGFQKDGVRYLLQGCQPIREEHHPTHINM